MPGVQTVLVTLNALGQGHVAEARKVFRTLAESPDADVVPHVALARSTEPAICMV